MRYAGLQNAGRVLNGGAALSYGRTVTHLPLGVSAISVMVPANGVLVRTVRAITLWPTINLVMLCPAVDVGG